MTQVNAPPTPRDREIRRELRSWQSARASCIRGRPASGRIVTTMVDRPPAPLSRAERLSTYSIRRSSGGATGSRRAIPTKPRR